MVEAIFPRFPAKFRELIKSMGRHIAGNPKLSPSVSKNLVFCYLQGDRRPMQILDGSRKHERIVLIDRGDHTTFDSDSV